MKNKQITHIKFVTFGYFGPTETNELDIINKVATSERSEIGTVIQNSKKKKLFTDQEIKKISRGLASLAIDMWHDEYFDSSILDGEQWDFEAKFSDGKIIKCGGSNAYPPNFNFIRKLFHF